MAETREGGCLCGNIRYSVAGDPLGFLVCHCRDCQLTSGSDHAAVIMVARNQFSLLKGTPKAYSVTADSGNTLSREFCPDCGSPLFSEIKGNEGIWMIKALSLDDSSDLKPAMAIWTDSAPEWTVLPEDVNAFAKMPTG